MITPTTDRPALNPDLGLNGRPLVPSVCIHCRQPVGIWGGPYLSECNADGSAPIARMYGGFYTHSECG